LYSKGLLKGIFFLETSDEKCKYNSSKAEGWKIETAKS